MSGFSNPVVGGGGVLIRESIHSPDYNPGFAGWTINKDGTVEFNNATIRGELEVGVAPQIEQIGLTGSQIPVILINFSPDYDHWYVVNTYFYNSNTDDYTFDAIVHNTVFALIERITGQVIGGQVYLQQFVDGPTGATNTIHHGTDPYNVSRLQEDWRSADLTITSTATFTMATPANFKMGAWVDYSNAGATGMQITGSTTNPTLGNSHLFASYQMLNDKTCSLKFKLLIGGTWASGNGIYSLSLPFPAKLDSDGDAASIGAFRINDSGVAERLGVLDIASSTTIQGLLTTGSRVASTTQTWNNPDSWRGSIIYEIA